MLPVSSALGRSDRVQALSALTCSFYFANYHAADTLRLVHVIPCMDQDFYSMASNGIPGPMSGLAWEKGEQEKERWQKSRVGGCTLDNLALILMGKGDFATNTFSLLLRYLISIFLAACCDQAMPCIWVFKVPSSCLHCWHAPQHALMAPAFINVSRFVCLRT